MDTNFFPVEFIPKFPQSRISFHIIRLQACFGGSSKTRVCTQHASCRGTQDINTPGKREGLVVIMASPTCRHYPASPSFRLWAAVVAIAWEVWTTVRATHPLDSASRGAHICNVHACAKHRYIYRRLAGWWLLVRKVDEALACTCIEMLHLLKVVPCYQSRANRPFNYICSKTVNHDKNV